MAKAEDLRGQKFGRLTVLDRSPRKDGHTSWWICKCDCGNTKEIRGTSLKKGNTKSCGCYRSECGIRHGREMLTKHGWYGTRLYNIYNGVINRCENPSCPQYYNYGGRGIGICGEWRRSPQAFCEWATANGYSPELTLDRVDTNGNYEPSNCRWITIEEQQVNKRNNVRITFNGKTQCVAEWSRELGVIQHRLYQRIRAGWTDPQEILFGRKKGETYG